MATVYVETSIVSYLASRPSLHLVTLSRQLLTRRWWDEQRGEHHLFTSPFVTDEAAQGDPADVAKRLEFLSDMTLLDMEPQIAALADELLTRSILPAGARLAALHISTVAFHAIEYLLTWNCQHIANARLMPRVYRTLEDLGCGVPLICTIEEMMGDDDPLEGT